MDCIYHVEIFFRKLRCCIKLRDDRCVDEGKKNNGIESKLYVKRDLKKLAAWSSIIPGAKFKCVASIPLGYFI